MNKFLFSVYRVLVPKPVRTVILKRTLRKKILKHFASLAEKEIDAEHREVLRYLQDNPVRIFPYPFHDGYSSEKVSVFYDHTTGMRYVMQDGKKLFFKKRWSEKRIKRAYSDLMREQDINSPHRYLTDSFDVGSDEVVADIGAAEGNFSLAVIDSVKKIYLFEYDREWIEALRATFAPWSDKVEIINKYVAGVNDESHITLDSFCEVNNDLTFLKIDVDGAESAVLNSSEGILNSGRPLKVALCTYHKGDDEKDFTLLLKSHGFSLAPSKGYMIHYYDKKLKAPYLRRGLIRAVR